MLDSLVMSNFTFSGYDKTKYSAEENSKLEAAFNQITQKLVALFESGASPEDTATQAVIKEHYEFTCQFWIPTNDSYRSLAISYIIPTPARRTYESRAVGLARYIHDAIDFYAKGMTPSSEASKL